MRFSPNHPKAGYACFVGISTITVIIDTTGTIGTPSERGGDKTGIIGKAGSVSTIGTLTPVGHKPLAPQDVTSIQPITPPAPRPGSPAGPRPVSVCLNPRQSRPKMTDRSDCRGGGVKSHTDCSGFSS